MVPRKPADIQRLHTDSCGQKSPKKLSLAIRTFDCQFCGMSTDREHNAALNILFKAATSVRRERWVLDLCEMRNKNKAEGLGLEKALQLTLFEPLTSRSLWAWVVE